MLLQQMETLYRVAVFKINTTLTSVFADVPYTILPALIGGGTTRCPRKRLIVFGFGGSLEDSDSEQDAHKCETPQNHDQCHTSAGLVTVPGPTRPEEAPSFLDRSVILISKSRVLGCHFRLSSTFTNGSLKVNEDRMSSEVLLRIFKVAVLSKVRSDGQWRCKINLSSVPVSIFISACAPARTHTRTRSKSDKWKQTAVLIQVFIGIAAGQQQRRRRGRGQKK